MDFTKYTNQLPTVRKDDFMTVHVYKNGKCLGTHRRGDLSHDEWRQLHITIKDRQQIKELIFDELAFKQARAAYDAHTRQLREQFKTDTLHDLSVPVNPFSDALFEMAWQNRRSEGWSAVYDDMNELTDIYEIARNHFTGEKIVVDPIGECGDNDRTFTDLRRSQMKIELPKKITSTFLQSNIIGADSVSKRDGVFTLRRGFFYRSGTHQQYAQRISQQLTEMGINHTVVDSGDKWVRFRGGVSVANGSHYWVQIKLN